MQASCGKLFRARAAARLGRLLACRWAPTRAHGYDYVGGTQKLDVARVDVAAGRAFTPETTGDVVAWLATHPEANAHAGKLLSTPTFFKDHGITA